MNACEKTCVYVWRGNRNLQKVQPSAGFGFSGWLKATPVAVSDGHGLGTGSGRARDGLGTARDGLAAGPLARTRTLLQGSNFVAGAAFWQGRVQISWQGQHFREVRNRFRGRGITFARSSTEFLAGAALSQGQVQNSWQVQRFRKVKCKICGRRSTFARPSTDFVAGAALSQGQVQNLWQAQHFRKVKYRFRGRRSTFARSSTDLMAGAALLQGQLSQPRLENRNF